MPDIGVDAAGSRDDVHHAVVPVAQAVAELSTAVELVLNVDDALLWPVLDRGKNMQLILWDNLDLVGIRPEMVRPDVVFVRLSVLLVPVSSTAARSRAAGADSAVVSTVMSRP